MVFKDDQVVYKEIINSGKEGDKNINDDTIFPVWSMSKPITIVAIMTLFEDGLIDFNDDESFVDGENFIIKSKILVKFSLIYIIFLINFKKIVKNPINKHVFRNFI